MPFYTWKIPGEQLILKCHLQPKAKKDEFCGNYGDSLKIRITAPPVDGKANKYLVRFLAKSFGVRQADVIILNGESSREKRILIQNPKKIPEILGITNGYTS